MKASTLKQLLVDAGKFDQIYDHRLEDEADVQRGEFLRRFPSDILPSLTLTDYAIGQNKRETFCYWAEPGTDKWARITGATAAKFGIYFGRAGEGTEARYRYTKKFAGDLPMEGAHAKVFEQVRAQLVDLVRRGRALDFDAVDRNPLSQMLKAKVLSLYFDRLYLPICSDTILWDLVPDLELQTDSLSAIQHEAMALKQKSPVFRSWHNLKLTAFLIARVSGAFEGNGASPPTSPPKKPKIPNLDLEPNFDELAKRAREKGEKSERFALEREASRLHSRGLTALIPRIKDRTKKPRYGYDFESFSAENEPRYIEVKTFTGSRFFLSANELRIAQSEEKGRSYFFYLVTYDASGEPVDCLIHRADEVLGWCDLKPQNFMVVAPKGFDKHLGDGTRPT